MTSTNVQCCTQVDQLDLLAEHVDASNYTRTCLYLTSTSSYLPQPDDRNVLVKARHPVHAPVTFEVTAEIIESVLCSGDAQFKRSSKGNILVMYCLNGVQTLL